MRDDVNFRYDFIDVNTFNTLIDVGGFSINLLNS